MINRRELIGAAGGVALLSSTGRVAAQQKPSTIKIICGYPAGGLTDTFRYDECAEYSLRGEVLCLRLRSLGAWGTFPAALFGPEPRAALRSAAQASRLPR